MKASTVRIKPTVVIVEGIALARAGLVAMLADSPWQVWTTLELPHQRELNRPAALVLGHDRFLGEGFPALRQICARVTPCPVVVVLPLPHPAHEMRCLGAGAAAVVSWSTDRTGLIHAIEAAIAGRRHVPTPADCRCPAAPAVQLLSPREVQVFETLGFGLCLSEIAAHFRVSRKTVETLRERIKNKLGAESAVQLGAMARAWVLAHVSQENRDAEAKQTIRSTSEPHHL